MRLVLAYLVWWFDFGLDGGECGGRNEVWGLDGRMKRMRVFHSMTKPGLWIRLKEVQR